MTEETQVIFKIVRKCFADRKAVKQEAETRAHIQGLQEKLREKFEHLKGVQFFAASEPHPFDAERIGYLKRDYFAEALRLLHLVNESQ